MASYVPGPLDPRSIVGLSPAMAHCHGVYNSRTHTRHPTGSIHGPRFRLCSYGGTEAQGEEGPCHRPHSRPGARPLEMSARPRLAVRTPPGSSCKAQVPTQPPVLRPQQASTGLPTGPPAPRLAAPRAHPSAQAPVLPGHTSDSPWLSSGAQVQSCFVHCRNPQCPMASAVHSPLRPASSSAESL